MSDDRQVVRRGFEARRDGTRPIIDIFALR